MKNTETTPTKTVKSPGLAYTFQIEEKLTPKEEQLAAELINALNHFTSFEEAQNSTAKLRELCHGTWYIGASGSHIWVHRSPDGTPGDWDNRVILITP